MDINDSMQPSLRRSVVTLLAFCVVAILSAKIALSEHEDKKSEFLELINRYRQENGMAPLKVSGALAVAAQLHSEDMAAQNYFSHTSLDGRTFVDRIRQAGYTYNTWLGENIAAGYDTAQAVFEAWRSSTGHNANMLNPNFVVIGIGIAYNSSSLYGWYWTTDFGGYDDSTKGDNSPPNTPQAPSGPTLCALNASYGYSVCASDPDGDDVHCVFDWGDGTYTRTGMGNSGSYFRAEHAWSSLGAFQVRVQVFDSSGKASSWSQPISVVVKLASSISADASGASVFRGENLTISGSVSPPHECLVTLTLTKPDGSRLVKQVQTDKNGNYLWVANPDVVGTWSVSASWPGDHDHLGSSSEAITFKVDPPLHSVVIKSSAEGARVFVDGFNYSTPCAFRWAEGTTHRLVVETTLAVGEGARYVFEGWSDGCSSESREVVVTGPATYVANYTVQYLISVRTRPDLDEVIAWQEQGAIVHLSVNSTLFYQDNFSRLVFVGWSDNTTSPDISFVVSGPRSLEARWKRQFLVQVNSPYDEAEGGGWHDDGSQAFISLCPSTLELCNGTRVVFERWVGEGPGSYSGSGLNITLAVDGPLVESAIWRTQYLVEARSAHGHITGGGWYDASSLARISVEPVVNETATSHFVFSSWKGCADTDGPEVLVVVNSPLKLEAVWRREFYLNVCSTVGSTWGSGWYPEGSVASFGVKPPSSEIMPSVFDGWTGDVVSNALNATTLMDRPKVVVAKWHKGLLTSVVAFLAIGGVAVPILSICKRTLAGKNKGAGKAR